MLFRILVLFFVLTLVAKAEEVPDYLLYDVPLVDDYTRVNSPHVRNKLTTRINMGYSPNPYVLMSNTTNEVLDPYIEHLGHFDASVQKSFGDDYLHPFVSLNVAGQKSSGTQAPPEFFQKTDVIAGLAFGAAGEFEIGVAGIKSIDIVDRQTSNGVMFSGGIKKENYGVAMSAITHDISSKGLETSVGTYVGTDKYRLNLEYTTRFTDNKIPSQVTVAARTKLGKVFVMPAFSIGTNTNLGSSTNFMLSISMDLGKKKQPPMEEEKPVEEEEKPTEEEQKTEENTEETSAVEEKPEVTEDSEEKVATEELIKEDVIENPEQDTADVTTTSSAQAPVASKNKATKRSKSNIKKSSGEKSMKDPKLGPKTESYELQPAAPVTPEQLTQLSQSTGDNGTLGLLLAIIAVVGGGAAWKFYTQYSEQKHEQKMKQMELQAKANGLAGAQPPPCQTANAKIQAELKEMKGKLANVDKKLALTADFDADLLERKVKKMERRLKDLEEDQD